MAAWDGDVEKLEILLKNGARPTVQDISGDTALHWAAGNGNSPAVACIAEHLTASNSIDAIDLKNKKGDTALHAAAARTSQSQATSTLLKYGANLSSGNFGNTPLHVAVMHDNRPTVEILLRHLSANRTTDIIEFKNFNGQTAFHLATSPEMLNVLLKNNAKLSTANDGKTTLHYAVRKNDLQAVECILKYLKEMNLMEIIELKCLNGETALHWATAHGPDIEVLRILLKYNASVTAQDNDGDTPLHWAVVYNNAQAVGCLAEHQQTRSVNAVEIKNSTGSTPLHLAAAAVRDAKVLSVLLLFNPKLCAKDGNGNTALHIAASRGNVGAVDIILKEVTAYRLKTDKSDFVNLKNKLGKTARQLAAMMKNNNLLQVFNKYNL